MRVILYMQKELKEKFPDWVWNINPGQHNLTLTDDADSLLSASLIKSKFGTEIKYFYTFNEFYQIGNSDSKTSIAVDCALEPYKKGDKTVFPMCFDNHVTLLHQDDHHNQNSANINAIKKINRENYHEKWSGSTLLQLYSLYGIPLPATDEGKKILLSVDVSFKPLFMDQYKKTAINHMEDLMLDDLIDFALGHTMEDFYETIKKYKLSKEGKIFFKDSFLHTQLPIDEIQKHFSEFEISLPHDKLNIIKKFNSCKGVPLDWRTEYSKEQFKNVFSMALTRKNFLSYTA